MAATGGRDIAGETAARTGGHRVNIVDDTPATFRQLVTGIADARQVPRPLVVPQWVLAMAAPYGKALFAGNSMRVSNARAQEELSWIPKYPSISDGIQPTSCGVDVHRREKAVSEPPVWLVKQVLVPRGGGMTGAACRHPQASANLG